MGNILNVLIMGAIMLCFWTIADRLALLEQRITILEAKNEYVCFDLDI